MALLNGNPGYCEKVYKTHKDKHKKSQFEPLPSERHNINLHCQLWGCFPFANLSPDENQALNQDQ